MVGRMWWPGAAERPAAIGPARSASGDRAKEEETEWSFLCPECGEPAFVAGSYLHCPAEGRRFAKKDGIYPLLSRARRRALRSFLEAYRIVRRAEGWGGDAQYYLDLPFRDRSGRHPDIWRMRARSFRAALKEIRRASGAGALRVLEIGAGNCWFSSRMARLGHRVLATDIHLDAEDGLGAYNIYRDRLRASIDRAEADMGALALADSQFDLVVANGSIHYARPVRLCLAEAHRVLGPAGLLLILDSPTYRGREAGLAMVRRRMRDHERQYALSADPEIQSGFLLLPDVLELLDEVGFAVRIVHPFPGVERWLRRFMAEKMGWSPPAEFPVIAARKCG